MLTVKPTLYALAAAFAALATATAHAEIKIGVVNFQRLVEEAPQTKTSMQALKNEFSPRERDIVKMQNDLKASEDKLQREGSVMSESDRSKAEKTLRDGQRELSRKVGEFQDDAGTRRNEELGKVQRFLLQEVQTYASAQGYDLVVGDGVLYAKSAFDITPQLLGVLSTKPASIPNTAPPGAPGAPAAPAKPATPPPAKQPQQ
jgi:outer membrane protein